MKGIKNESKLLFAIILVFTCISCKLKSENRDVPLIFKAENTPNINSENFPLEVFPDGDTVPFDGIPADIGCYKVFEWHPMAFDYKALERLDKGDISRKQFLQLAKERGVYAPMIPRTKLNENILILSGKSQRERIVIPDLNGNKDFGDDKIYRYELNQKQKKMMESSRSKMFYEHTNNSGKKRKDSLNVRFYPSPNYFSEFSDSLANELQIIAQPFGHWTGDFTSESKEYRFFVQKHLFYSRPKIIIGEELPNNKIKYINGPSFYSVSDTLRLENESYKITYYDSLAPKLELKKITRLERPKGVYEGLYSKNHIWKSIEGKPINLSEILEHKDAILLDFWGTWCVPCRELNPNLKSLKKENKNIEIIGIAYDRNKELVQNYIQKNNNLWPQIFVDQLDSGENSPISEWKVEKYPTYVLLDKDLKISYRGTGEKAFKKISKLISNKK